jgi:hypothetical protein
MTSTEIVSSLTSQQKHFAAAYLASTCDELSAAVTDLSPSQASFRREPDEWCIAGVVEHLAIIEGRVQALISRLPEGTPSAPDRNDAATDEFIIQTLPHRTSRVPAPDAALPKGQCTLTEALDDFRRKREDTIRLLEYTPCLRGRTMPHPVFGHWDGYQWILAAGAHAARHLAQIREIRSHAAFPRSPRGVGI